MDDLPPEPKPRARLAHYLFERRMTSREAGKALGVSYEQVRRVCLPLDDPDWRRPSDKLKQRVAAWTRGAVAGPEAWPEPARARV